MLALILWLVAAVCFLLAGCGVTSDRVNLVAFGLFFATLTFLIPGVVAA